MESIPELSSPVHINKENGGVGGSPVAQRSLRTKKSLSILSANDVAKRTAVQRPHDSPTKPMGQRLVSESTGLVKFALKTDQKPAGDEHSGRKTGLPMYIPVDDDSVSPVRRASAEPKMMDPCFSPQGKGKATGSVISEEEELLFKYAKKQREVMELKFRLEQSEVELKALESQLSRTNLGANTAAPRDKPVRDRQAHHQHEHSHVNPQHSQQEAQTPRILTNLTSPVLEFKKRLQEAPVVSKAAQIQDEKFSPIRQALKTRVSMFNMAEAPKQSISKKPSMMKIKHDFNEISTNFINDGRKFQTDFFNRGKAFIDNFQTDFAFNNGTAIKTDSTTTPSSNLSKSSISSMKTHDTEATDLSYPSDEEAEDLDGGEVVPYEI